MTAAYPIVLGGEGAVVTVAGAVIAVTAVRNSEVVLYARALGAAGFGLTAGGVATILFASGVPDLASAFVVAAALAFVLSGWRLAVDGFQTRDYVRPPPGNGEVAGGFEEAER